jgi:hypothetical protein
VTTDHLTVARSLTSERQCAGLPLVKLMIIGGPD